MDPPCPTTFPWEQHPRNRRGHHGTLPHARRMPVPHGHAGEISPRPCFLADDYKSELREQLPLIAGSAAAGVVFIVSLVAISIVCSRWVLLGRLQLGEIWGRKGSDGGHPCSWRER